MEEPCLITLFDLGRAFDKCMYVNRIFGFGMFFFFLTDEKINFISYMFFLVLQDDP